MRDKQVSYADITHTNITDTDTRDTNNSQSDVSIYFTVVIAILPLSQSHLYLLFSMAQTQCSQGKFSVFGPTVAGEHLKFNVEN